MKHLAWAALITACGASGPPEPAPSNASPSSLSAPVRPERPLDVREIVDRESGANLLVWLRPEREPGIDTQDPCCGVSYDGNKYDDALASCAVHADECPQGTAPVYPGLADDHVCGARRRCVPLPEVRVVVADGTQVTALDGEDNPIGSSRRPVVVGREGFVQVTIADKTQLVAVDYGSRYTIVVREGRIDRVTLD